MRRTSTLICVLGFGLIFLRAQPAMAVVQRTITLDSPTPVKHISQNIATAAACDQPANPIVAENCQPGSDAWIVRKYQGDIAGFAYPTSVNLGETVNLYVDTHAHPYSMMIFRSGYYGGTGGRLLKTIAATSGTTQPACRSELGTGLTTCSTWTSTYSLGVPTDWVSGIYIVKLVNGDTGGENYMLFTVRDDNRHSTILVQSSLFTYTAYNNYGGKAVYSQLSTGCPTVSGMQRAVKVSFFRPYSMYHQDESGQSGGAPPDDLTLSNANNSYFMAEYPMVHWLESQGYDVSYATTLDTHRSGETGARNALLDHKIFVVTGHSEYWTQEMRDAITAARDKGVHLAFFSANTDYWRVRLESDPVTNAPDSVMVVYKTIESGSSDPTGFSTSTWRDPNGPNNPENSLTGSEYIGDNDATYFPLRISADQTTDPLFRHTGLDQMPAGTYANFGRQVVGWEWDAAVDNGHAPNGLKVLASSPTYGFLLGANNPGNVASGNLGLGAANTTRYTSPSGAIVFSTGTILWAWGLGAQGVLVTPPDRTIQQMTVNILADMGAQPTTPSASVILDADPKPATADGPFLPLNAAPPVISNVQTTIKASTVTITWHTETETIGTVWRGDSPDHIIHSWIVPSGDTPIFGRDHSVTASDLTPFTTQYFKIAATDRAGQTALSDANVVTLNNGSILTRLRYALALGDRAAAAKCWIQSNIPAAIGIGMVVIVAIIAMLFGVVRMMRNRRTQGIQLKGST